MRLTKLIVSGFKSFADRVEFNFEAGVTCIVGPNGCGKSNVVDAIKWALGEQSAKNLRGKEMADVIFNGSDTRKPMGMAEVTLTFDNSDRILPLAADTVQIGRRLFRSGDSEYLINKSPARLKDVRDLFFDTGVGRTGYSIIEQGRISQFAESSPKDRRVIFEEAAGISKFKVRLTEAARKLESVNANLARVGDVIDEVERQLRSVKVQAGRARTWREVSERLHSLRMLHFKADFNKLAGELAGALARQRTSRQAAEEVDRQVRQAQTAADELTRQQEELAGQHRLAESARDATRTQLRQCRSQIQSGEERIDDQTRNARTAGERAESQRRLLAHLEQEAALRQKEADELAGQVEAGHRRIAEAQEAVAQAARQEADLQARLDDENSGLMDLIRRTTWLHRDMESLARESEQLTAQHQRLSTRGEKVRTELAEQVTLQEGLHAKEKEITALLTEQKAALEAKQHEARQLGDQRSLLAGAISEAKQRRSGLASRQNVLSDLERRREGVSAGPRSVLDRSRQPSAISYQPDPSPSLFPGVHGMVADVFNTDARHAGAIEAALGPLAQAVIVESVAEVRTNAEALASLPGRVTFIGLDELSGRTGILPVAPSSTGVTPVPEIETTEKSTPPEDSTVVRDPAIHPGVLGWATDFVRCESRFAALKQALLGQTLLVESLKVVERFRHLWPTGTRWVTLAGEMLNDAQQVATWTVGPAGKSAQEGSGLISRRAELAELADVLRTTEEELATLQERLAGLGEAIGHSEEVQKELRQAIYAASTEQTDLANRLSRVKEAIRRLTIEEPLLANEAGEITRRLTEARTQHAGNQQELQGLNERKSKHDQAVAELKAKLAEAQTGRGRFAVQYTEAREESARLTTRRSGILSELAALGRRMEEARRTLAGADGEISDALARAESAHRAVLTARMQLAEACRQLESDEAELQGWAARQLDARQRLSIAAVELKRLLEEQSARSESLHQAAMDSSNAQVRVENVIARAKDEMGLDLLGNAEVAAPTPQPPVPTAGSETPTAEVPPSNVDGEIPSAEVAGALVVAPAIVFAGLEQEYETGLETSFEEVGVAQAKVFLAAFRIPRDTVNKNWEEVAKEIADLKARLDRLGNVNLDAINELSELERRQTFLTGQRDDLQRAAGQLHELIERLNAESRQRFAEAFATIRGNFQAMFRKLFGGGRADIILEKNPDGTEADILDAGIEIIACPPGKKNQSLSLYSGGEKAMIAVAMLMSIFQSKPSPFCLLDEVDAPLDEANNQRFNGIIKEFLNFSQFVIITHSKPTMAMADRMYGVTMQEKGVSKKVGVQFDAAGKAGMVDDAEPVAAGAA